MRVTTVTCDNRGCGMSEEAGEASRWIQYKRAKNKHDFCSAECFGNWFANQPKQLDMLSAVGE